MGIKENIEAVQREIESAKVRAGRTDTVTLVAVTKRHSREEVEEVLSAGIGVIAENRVKEALEKDFPSITAAKKHLIGTLQTNKVGKAVKLFDMIQSVDSIRLAEEISKYALKEQRVMPVLLEVNYAGETQKQGFSKEEVIEAVKTAAKLPGIHIKGIMGMAPVAEDSEEVRYVFRGLKGLFEEIRNLKIENAEMEILSMGMSHDFSVAVEEGATMVRVGSRIFTE